MKRFYVYENKRAVDRWQVHERREHAEYMICSCLSRSDARRIAAAMNAATQENVEEPT